MAKDKGKLGRTTGSSGGGIKGTGLGNKPRGAKTRVAKDERPAFAFERNDRPKMNRPRVERQSQPLDDMRLGEMVIDRMGHDGRGIATWNGKTLFVSGALSGERITARLVQDHARFAEGRIDQLLEVSPERVEPPCPHFNECGGCQLQHISPQFQLGIKAKAMEDQLNRWAGAEPKKLLLPISDTSQGYRRTARLSVWYDEDAVRVGFRQSQSREVVDISQCMVLAPALNLLISALKQWLSQLVAKKAVTHIELISADTTAVVIRHTKALDPADLIQLSQVEKHCMAAIWLQPQDDGQLIDLHGTPVDPRLTYTLGELTLGFHPNDFIQVNPNVNQQMVSQALELLKLTGKERVLDLFCGIGNFTLPIAKQCKEVIGLEAIPSMVARGVENAERNHIKNAQFIAADLTKMNLHRINQLCGKIDAVLLDPPRDGAKEMMPVLAQLSPKRIVYVSCNPATLARDAKLLVEAGYRLDAAGAMDMFPHTEHVESIALFKRR